MSGDLHNLTAQLDFLLSHAGKAYGLYLEKGRKFAYAQVLYAANDRIRELLQREILTLPEDRRDDAGDLLMHIEVWQAIWTDERARQAPGWSDPFVFETELPFPRAAVERLLAP